MFGLVPGHNARSGPPALAINPTAQLNAIQGRRFSYECSGKAPLFACSTGLFHRANKEIYTRAADYGLEWRAGTACGTLVSRSKQGAPTATRGRGAGRQRRRGRARRHGHP